MELLSIFINFIIGLGTILINFKILNQNNNQNQKIIEKEKEKLEIEIEKTKIEIKKIELEKNKILYEEVKKNNKILIKELIILKKYYELFILGGYEFKKSELPENFAPLKLKEDFYYNIEELYYSLDNDIIKSIDELKNKLEFHCKIALYIAQNDIDKKNGKEIDIDYVSQVESISNDTIDFIEKIILKIIKKEQDILIR